MLQAVWWHPDRRTFKDAPALLLSAAAAASAVAQDASDAHHLPGPWPAREAGGFLPNCARGRPWPWDFDLHHHRFHWTIIPL